MSLFESIWDVLVLLFWAFVFISALIAVVMVIVDLFRDRKLNGWAKAAWILFLVLVPLLTSLVYLIARGQGMAERVDEDAKESKDATDAYIREVAGASPADEIAKAKALLDSGAITAEEFAALKGRVLSAA
ncbi:SHOCT domain-containing protein [Leucobacter luti]|uniref:Putative oligomerization/nucleic acid binding protein n=1 Tax=Leucobacter luti TaxID=340320 RepID=A0A4V6MDK5_9MICO|nr:SHOCT domain-containing protein [Leucobacter luti]RZT68389.1 putative oligomerization/nucleic acid binding protein [Leucobacter luti]